MQKQAAAIEVHGHAAGICVLRGDFGNGVLHSGAGIAAVRAAKAAEMTVGAVIVGILRLAVDAVRRVGKFRGVARLQRHVDSEKPCLVRHMLRDGRDERIICVQAQERFRRMRDALDDVAQRMRDLAVAVELVAKDVRRDDDLGLEILQNGLGRGLVALDDRELLFAFAGERALHGKLRRDAGDEVRAGFVSQIALLLVDERLLDHARAGGLAVCAGDEDRAHALRERTEHGRTDLQRDPARHGGAAAPHEADQKARDLAAENRKKYSKFHW